MTKAKETDRQTAERHWQYNKGLIQKLDTRLTTDYWGYLEVMHYLYVEAFIHGIKHGKQK